MLYKLLLVLNFLFSAEPNEIELGQIGSISHEEQEEETQNFTSISDFLQTIRKEQRRTLGRPVVDNSSDDPENCCGVTGGCHACICGKTKIAYRIIWKIIHSTSWTLAGLSNYTRRTMIPIAAFGNYDDTDQQKILIGIGILQIVGETCETIYDYSENKLINREEKLTKLHLRRKNEKEHARTRALQNCARLSIPRMGIEQAYLQKLTPQQQQKFTKALIKTYEPRSGHLRALESELTDATRLTGCEMTFEKIRFGFWTKSYPFFWGIGVTLSLAQLFIVALNLADPAENLKLAILLITTETINYFCESMKNIGQDEKFHHEKLRKTYENPDADDLV